MRMIVVVVVWQNRRAKKKPPLPCLAGPAINPAPSMLFEATHTDHGDAVDGVEDDGVALEYRLTTTQGGKNRRRGKNESDHEKRELTFKEDGQGQCNITSFVSAGRNKKIP